MQNRFVFLSDLMTLGCRTGTPGIAKSLELLSDLAISAIIASDLAIEIACDYSDYRFESLAIIATIASDYSDYR